MMPCVIIVTGVAGAGKSTVGRILSEMLGWDFFDADHYHSDENVSRMARGIPLTDEDRGPWLETLAALIDVRLRHDAPAVLACSALKTSYRTVLSSGRKGIAFVYLHVDAETLERRLRERTGHFAGVTLLASQLSSLERGDDMLVVDAHAAPDDVARLIVEALELDG